MIVEHIKAFNPKIIKFLLYLETLFAFLIPLIAASIILVTTSIALVIILPVLVTIAIAAAIAVFSYNKSTFYNQHKEPYGLIGRFGIPIANPPNIDGINDIQKYFDYQKKFTNIQAIKFDPMHKWQQHKFFKEFVEKHFYKQNYLNLDLGDISKEHIYKELHFNLLMQVNYSGLTISNDLLEALKEKEFQPLLEKFSEQNLYAINITGKLSEKSCERIKQIILKRHKSNIPSIKKLGLELYDYKSQHMNSLFDSLKFSYISDLDLTMIKNSDEADNLLLKLNSIKTLTSVNLLYYLTFNTNFSGTKFIGSNKSIKNLSIACHTKSMIPSSTGCIDLFKKLKNNTNLESLELYSGLIDFSNSMIHNLNNFPLYEKTVLKELCEFITNNKALRSLHIHDADSNNETYEQLNKAIYLHPSMQSLTLIDTSGLMGDINDIDKFTNKVCAIMQLNPNMQSYNVLPSKLSEQQQNKIKLEILKNKKNMQTVSIARDATISNSENFNSTMNDHSLYNTLAPKQKLLYLSPQVKKYKSRHRYLQHAYNTFKNFHFDDPEQFNQTMFQSDKNLFMKASKYFCFNQMVALTEQNANMWDRTNKENKNKYAIGKDPWEKVLCYHFKLPENSPAPSQAINYCRHKMKTK